MLTEPSSQNCVLASLDVGDNLITAHGVLALAAGIAKNRSLLSLGLWGNAIDYPGHRRPGATRLSEDDPPMKLVRAVQVCSRTNHLRNGLSLQSEVIRAIVSGDSPHLLHGLR